eukprot:Opistho-2@2098
MTSRAASTSSCSARQCMLSRMISSSFAFTTDSYSASLPVSALMWSLASWMDDLDGGIWYSTSHVLHTHTHIHTHACNTTHKTHTNTHTHTHTLSLSLSHSP